MKPGHGEILLTEGDPELREDEERLIGEFRRQLDEGMWAAVPTQNAGSGRREAMMVRSYTCLLYTSPSPRDRTRSRMPSSA